MGWATITDPPRISHPISWQYPVTAAPQFRPFISPTFLFVSPLNLASLTAQRKTTEAVAKV